MEKNKNSNLLLSNLQSLRDKVDSLGDIFHSVNVSMVSLNSAYRSSAMWQPVYIDNND
ncbi:MAG: hypothetical protein WBA74_25680 [Cyclobacteriaceae bacterium]